VIHFQAAYETKNIPSNYALLFRYVYVYFHYHTFDSTLIFSTAILLNPFSLKWVYSVSLLVLVYLCICFFTYFLGRIKYVAASETGPGSYTHTCTTTQSGHTIWTREHILLKGIIKHFICGLM
jgi:hypothetical protein